MPTPTLRLRWGRHIEDVPTSSIVRVEGDANYSLFHLADGRTCLCPRTLKFYQHQLPGHFLRVHRGCLVNADYVAGWPSASVLMLTNGGVVPVSRRRIAYFRQHYSALCPRPSTPKTKPVL
jgi:DNA-binding LytR/AlgR family response regulator